MTAMKTSTLLITILLLTEGARAGTRTSTNYSIITDTTDAGGQRASSTNYSNAGSVNLIAGNSTVAAPAEAVKAGYIAQLYDITGLIVNSAQPSVNENESVQLAAWQLLDDATFLAADANAVMWGAAVAPIASISASGLATAQTVYEDTPASVEGSLGGFTGALNLTVLNVNTDDFGTYAGDGIDDAWQYQYFGLDNPLAAPGLDPDDDGGTNAFEFTAGLVPTDPSSTFRLHLEAIPGQPTRRNVVFSPRLDGRSYIVASCATLGVAWTPLTTFTESDNGDERTVTDLNATGATKFYRVEITKP
jgi:hypothetical protein